MTEWLDTSASPEEALAAAFEAHLLNERGDRVEWTQRGSAVMHVMLSTVSKDELLDVLGKVIEVHHAD